MKAAFASAVLFVVMLIVALLSVGQDWGQLPIVAVVFMAALSIAFALIALGGAIWSNQPDNGWRPTSVLIALVVLGAFAIAIVAILIAFANSFE